MSKSFDLNNHEFLLKFKAIDLNYKGAFCGKSYTNDYEIIIINKN